jgi:hypothetical protein
MVCSANRSHRQRICAVSLACGFHHAIRKLDRSLISCGAGLPLALVLAPLTSSNPSATLNP